MSDGAGYGPNTHLVEAFLAHVVEVGPLLDHQLPPDDGRYGFGDALSAHRFLVAIGATARLAGRSQAVSAARHALLEAAAGAGGSVDLAQAAADVAEALTLYDLLSAPLCARLWRRWLAYDPGWRAPL